MLPWHRVVGEGDKTPVVICHGGPGAGHDYVEPIAELSRFGRRCVLYDQFGCGRSEHRPDAPPEFWTVQLFKDELVELTRHLGIADRYAVVGQSWGGMLALEHALDHPPGLRAIVVADSPASMELWVEEANRLRAELPSDVQATLTRHEEAGTTDDPEYEEAVNVFYERHLCRITPMPDPLVRSFAQMAEDPTVYRTMNGPSEFHVVGSLRGWDITDRLHEIDVPTLLVSGRYDEATPRIVGEIHKRIVGSEWSIFEASSHTPHLEEPQEFLEVVERFLGSHAD
jgi:L-proline amide hydrolase